MIIIQRYKKIKLMIINHLKEKLIMKRGERNYLMVSITITKFIVILYDDIKMIL